ncbi:hypothetical protein E2C01_072949 [Portunus trituberculatus]|uniref:Uncharacterized protein n=1 Tax=Portunus trituberculatus TaxID=210409 RepID=A0A5B7I3X9_PORTR|nr:hypothetical protein [Portunus trituberculatus]
MRSPHRSAGKGGTWSLGRLHMHPPPIPPSAPPPSPPITNQNMNEGLRVLTPETHHPECMDKGAMMDIQKPSPPKLPAPSSPATARPRGRFVFLAASSVSLKATRCSVIALLTVVVMMTQGTLAQDSTIRLRQGNVKGVSMNVSYEYCM